uniref:Uncharacterized protein n=1 Tax=Anabas testudineus TaxID=64144 RepID=A0A3Q1JBF0_ANATE
MFILLSALYCIHLISAVEKQNICTFNSQVSLRLKGSHFCGGAILTGRWIMTAAHCFGSVSNGVTVAAGEFDRRVDDEDEQVFHVKSVSVHEKYHHTSPMSYDIALPLTFTIGVRIQPICLPLPDEKIIPETGCIVGGWGKIKERGRLPATLREVQLNLVDQAKCKYVLQTVKSSVLNQALVRPESAMTVLCAGPERGGRDACQGDSGGPLVCPAGSGRGLWVVLGITSWGKGCGRSWGNNSIHPPSRRGSPGVFTDVRLLLPWIKRKLREVCVCVCVCLLRLCLWSISVPAGYSILLVFEHFELENDSHCRYDRLTVSAGSHRPVGCGTVVLVEEQTVIHSPNYPQSYSNDCAGHCVVFQIDFVDMDLEESDTCLYDSLSVLGDVEQTEELALLCGGSVPPAVLSYHNIMVLQFTSDASITHRGFRATLTFISHTGTNTCVSSDRSTTRSNPLWTKNVLLDTVIVAQSGIATVPSHHLSFL